MAHMRQFYLVFLGVRLNERTNTKSVKSRVPTSAKGVAGDGSFSVPNTLEEEQTRLSKWMA